MSGWYPHAGLAQGNATATTPPDQWIGGGEAPILVVQPTHDAAAEHGAKKLRNLHPDRVTALTLEDAGHAILPEQPEEVTRMVLEHLAGRDAGEKLHKLKIRETSPDGVDSSGLLIDGAVANMTVLPNQSGQIIENLHLISSYRHAPIAERTDREISMG